MRRDGLPSGAGSGWSADCVASQPPVSATITIDSVTRPSVARNRARRSSRASVLFPTCTSVPSGSARDDGLQRATDPSPVGHAEDERFRAAIDDAHEQALGRRALLGADRRRSARGAAARVDGGVLAELLLDDLPIALRPATWPSRK